MGEVECYSGYEYAEKPVAFYYEGHRLEVKEIEARWRTPSGRVFCVRSSDGRRFELFYDQQQDQWRVTAAK